MEARLLGTVLNAMPAQRLNEHCGHGYGYGHEPREEEVAVDELLR